jgi:hypothetical protein
LTAADKHSTGSLAASQFHVALRSVLKQNLQVCRWQNAMAIMAIKAGFAIALAMQEGELSVILSGFDTKRIGKVRLV